MISVELMANAPERSHFISWPTENSRPRFRASAPYAIRQLSMFRSHSLLFVSTTRIDGCVLNVPKMIKGPTGAGGVVVVSQFAMLYGVQPSGSCTMACAAVVAHSANAATSNSQVLSLLLSP